VVPITHALEQRDAIVAAGDCFAIDDARAMKTEDAGRNDISRQ
jgi:hypothetical protein